MSTRAQVLIEDTGVYLYQHCDGYDLPSIVKEALSSKRGFNRWDDPEYLARIIFSHMIRDHIDEGTGFGINTEKHGDIQFFITVNCKDKCVTVEEGYGNKWETISNQTFQEVLAETKKEN